MENSILDIQKIQRQLEFTGWPVKRRGERYILATHLGKYNGRMSCEDVRYEVEERGRNQGGSGGIGIESEKWVWFLHLEVRGTEEKEVEWGTESHGQTTDTAEVIFLSWNHWWNN